MKGVQGKVEERGLGCVVSLSLGLWVCMFVGVYVCVYVYMCVCCVLCMYVYNLSFTPSLPLPPPLLLSLPDIESKTDRFLVLTCVLPRDIREDLFSFHHIP